MPLSRFNEIKLTLLKAKRVDNYLKEVDPILYEQEKKMLDEEWTKKNEEAKILGTSVHELIHNMFCTDTVSIRRNLGIDTELYLLSPLENLLNTEKGVFSELKLEIPLDDNYLLVGIIDCLIKDGNHLTIIDFKTDESIKFKSIFDVGKKRTKKMKYPLSTYDDVNGIHYLIQLSLYAKMLLKLNPDFIIDTLRIVLIKDLKVKKFWDVEYLSKDMDKLLAWHIKNLKIKKETDKCKAIIY